jgi:hypothetical protein
MNNYPQQLCFKMFQATSQALRRRQTGCVGSGEHAGLRREEFPRRFDPAFSMVFC